MSHPIEEKFLDRNQTFGLEYREGLVFASIRGIEDTVFKPFEQLEDVEASTSLDGGFQRLSDANGDDVLFVDPDQSNDRYTVLHASVGIHPAQIRMFTRYPEGEAKLHAVPNLEIPTVSDNYAYVDGRMSPYRQPSEASELVIPPGQHISFNFYNPGNDAHFPTLNIVMRKYSIEPLDPNGNDNVKREISSAARVGSNRPIYPVGGFDTQVKFNLQSEWGIDPISIDEARELR